MKSEEVIIGTHVRVIGGTKDSPVYTIKEKLSPFTVVLTYVTETGRTVSGGHMDISLLKKIK